MPRGTPPKGLFPTERARSRARESRRPFDVVAIAPVLRALIGTLIGTLFGTFIIRVFVLIKVVDALGAHGDDAVLEVAVVGRERRPGGMRRGDVPTARRGNT